MSVPQDVGPYRIVRPLGQGGMGAVYLAHDDRLNRRVALKVFSGDHARDEYARHELLNEARAAASFNHPHIASVHDVLDVDGQIAIVFEFVEGETLADRLRRGPLGIDDTIDIGMQLADALAAAHDRGIVHRDLKPANIAITPRGVVKVLDFGVARMMPDSVQDAGGAKTTAAGFAGTVGYAAPEQCLGHSVDARADLFSLGIVLFEMLTALRPFSGGDPPAIVEAMLRDAAPRVQSIVPAVPSELDELIARLLSSDTARRPSFATVVRDALRAAQEGRRGSVVPPAPAHARGFPGTRPTRARMGRRLLVAALTVGLLAFVSVVVSRIVRGDRDSRSAAGTPIVAVLPLANITNDSSNDHIATGMTDVLIANLGRLPDVGVLPRSATLAYGEQRDTPRVARVLGADYVVDGTVQRSDEMLRVTIAVVAADNNLVAWSERYDGSVGEVFTLQRRLAEGVATALQLRLTPSQRRGLGTPPTSSEEAFAHYSAGRTFLDRVDVPGNIDRAIREFDAAIALDPAFATAYAGLGEAHWAHYQNTKERDAAARAQSAIEEAVRLDPGQPQVGVSLAIVYHGTGRSDEAVAALRRVITAFPNNDEARQVLGTIYADTAQPERAIEEIEAAIRIRPNFAAHHSSLALLHYRLGRMDAAIAAFRRAAVLQPDNAVTYRRLGTVYQSVGDNENALESYARANALAPDGPTYSNIGKLYYDQQSFAHAVAAFETAASLSPNDARIRRNLGDVYARLGRHDQARAAYASAVRLTEQLLAVNPRDARAKAMLAVYEAKRGRLRVARDHASEALALSPDDAEVLYRSAVVNALSNSPDAALQMLERAIARGYSAREARQDEDLFSLRGRARFEELVRF